VFIRQPVVLFSITREAMKAPGVFAPATLVQYPRAGASAFVGAAPSVRAARAGRIVVNFIAFVLWLACWRIPRRWLIEPSRTWRGLEPAFLRRCRGAALVGSWLQSSEVEVLDGFYPLASSDFTLRGVINRVLNAHHSVSVTGHIYAAVRLTGDFTALGAKKRSSGEVAPTSACVSRAFNRERDLFANAVGVVNTGFPGISL